MSEAPKYISKHIYIKPEDSKILEAIKEEKDKLGISESEVIVKALKQYFDFPDNASNLASWQLERKETIEVLRQFCSDYDLPNDWSDDLYIPDIIRQYVRSAKLWPK